MLCALISGTTKGTPSVIRHALLLSITTHPVSANFGAHSKLVSPPAENKAISGEAATAVARETTDHSFPQQETICPTLFSDATGMISS